MPGGDRTGPRGSGPMTGRGAGYCAGYPMPGYMNPAIPRRGFGFGFGRGWGRGRGFGRGRVFYGAPYYAAPYGPYPYEAPELAPQEEANMLKEEARVMQEELKSVKERISELESVAQKEKKNK